MITDHLKLCLVTNTQSIPFTLYKKLILQAIEGGITLVQLREKSKSIAQIRHIALELKEMLSPYKIPLIINDYVALAKEIDAEGIHLGQSDVSPFEARQLLGSNKIIGWSVESLAELETANQLTCIDYIAASAIFPSKTKSNCKIIWGLNGLKEMTRRSKHPVIAIGGVNQHNLQPIMASGASGVAVISAIHDQDNPKQATNDLIAAINLSIARKRYV